MKDSPEYARLVREMQSATDEEFVGDLTRFIGSFADHDPDCPGYDIYEPSAELTACTCGFARRHRLLGELRKRLARRVID